MKSEKNKMNSGRKSVFGTIFTLMLFISSVFAQFVVIAPAVLADNGVGEVTFFDIDNSGLPGTDITKGVQTVNTQKKHVYRIHNNDTGAIDCIDEIMITYPGSWQKGIDTSSVTVTNMGTVIITNEKDDGT